MAPINATKTIGGRPYYFVFSTYNLGTRADRFMDEIKRGLKSQNLTVRVFKVKDPVSGRPLNAVDVFISPPSGIRGNFSVDVPTIQSNGNRLSLVWKSVWLN